MYIKTAGSLPTLFKYPYKSPADKPLHDWLVSVLQTVSDPKVDWLAGRRQGKSFRTYIVGDMLPGL